MNCFLRDLTQRLTIDRAMSLDVAVRAVTEEAAGWYGCHSDHPGLNCEAEGLAEAMTSLVGPYWDASDAMLTWVLTQTGGDIVPTPSTGT